MGTTRTGIGCCHFLMMVEIDDGNDKIMEVEDRLISLRLLSNTHLAKPSPLHTFC